jgi:hypothetical protein
MGHTIDPPFTWQDSQILLLLLHLSWKREPPKVSWRLRRVTNKKTMPPGRPFVGIVDHVVVMPLEENHIDSTLLHDESGVYQLSKPAAWVACRIEKVSNQLGVGVIVMVI